MQTTKSYVYWSLLTVAIVSYLLLYFATWQDIERIWRSSATYNHCYLIIPISLWIFSRQKASATTTPQGKGGMTLPLILLCLLQLLYLAGVASGIALFMHLAAVVSLQLLLWLALGQQNARHHAFAIAYLIFLLPFGDELSPVLQHITADLTVFMLRLADIPIFREGLYLATPVGLFEVAEACSGLRFLIASIAISVLYAYLTYNKLIKQLVFVLTMIVVSVLANGARAFMLVYIGEKTDMAYGFGADHFVYGWLFFGAVLFSGFWLGSRFADQDTELVKASLVQPLAQKPALKVLPLLSGVLLLTLIYQLQLPEASAPAKPETIPLTLQNMQTPAHSDWGITFVDSLKQTHLQHDSGLEYFIAQYANKQQRGELISWTNTLYNSKVWFVTDTEQHSSFGLLQLKNTAQQHRVVLYWYQIGSYTTGSKLKAKLYQAMQLLSGNLGPATVFALSASGNLTPQTQQQLQDAAQILQQQATGLNRF